MAPTESAAAELRRLRGDLELGDPGTVLLFHGEDSFHQEAATALAVERLLAGSLREFNLDRRDGRETGPAEWMALAASRPMMGTRRVILVTAADRWLRASGLKEEEKEQQEALAAFAERAGARGGTLVLQASTADRRTRFWKTLQKAGRAYHFPPLKELEEAEAFLLDRFRGEGVRCDADACRYLAEALGTSTADLLTEVRRLVLYLGERRELTLADVEGRVADTRSHTVFEFVDALAQRDAARALRVLERLLEGRIQSDRKTDAQGVPLILVSLVHRQVRSMLLARSLVKDHGLDPSQLARELGVPPFVAQKTLRQARAVPPEQLQHALDLLAELDLRLKGSSLPDRALLEGLVFRLCAGRSR
ncbi:MAG: DNA polymerase III subunit delta [Deltaproteobacteria bacterium]|nr:DNA polymerase III subunit delta [Deltaproteobacteria bacterium]